VLQKNQSKGGNHVTTHSNSTYKSRSSSFLIRTKYTLDGREEDPDMRKSGGRPRERI